MVCEVFVFRYYEIFNEESLGIAVRTLGVAQRAVRHETAERAVAGADDMLPGIGYNPVGIAVEVASDAVHFYPLDNVASDDAVVVCLLYTSDAADEL